MIRSINREMNNVHIRRATTKVVATLAVLAAIGVASRAEAGTAPNSLVAYWNFNEHAGGINDFSIPIAADAGAGDIDLSGWGGNAEFATVFTGSVSPNALFGDNAGTRLAVEAGMGFAGNDTYIEFQVSMAGREDLALSYAYRAHAQSSGNSFSDHIWSWSTDGVNYNPAMTADVSDNFSANINGYHTESLDFSAFTDLNEATDVTLRLTLSGATLASGKTYLDNIQIHGNLIPAPGALAAFALAGLCGTRRRRS